MRLLATGKPTGGSHSVEGDGSAMGHGKDSSMRLRSVRVVTCGMLAALGVLSNFGCAMQSGDEGDVRELQEALIVGSWSGDLWNGDPGQAPWMDTSLVAKVPCEVYSTGDHWWHPGKLWAGNCRIQWGSGVYISPTYRALQVPSGTNYYWQQYSGFTPTNAVISQAGSLPVCKGFLAEWTLGKLWQGECWGEYNGYSRHSGTWPTVPFYVLVK